MSTVPDHKSQKYDRQLRMWQAHGQAALERAHVCLINATSVGTETLKNLVLPNLAAFTIIDPCLVTDEDLCNNFFVTPSDIGTSRAKVTAQHLKNLNSDVEAHSIAEDVAVLLKADPKFLLKYALVIVTGRVPLSSLLALDTACFQLAIPMIVVKTCGFVASLRTVLRAHHIVEKKPEYARIDLRLSRPWPQLLSFVNSFQSFDKMTSRELGHIPFPIILLRLFPQWQRVNPDASTSKFKAFINQEMHRHLDRFKKECISGADSENSSSQNVIDFINWTEAIGHAYLCLNTPSLDSTLKSTVLTHPILRLGSEHASDSSSSHVQSPSTILIPFTQASIPSTADGTASWPPAFWALAAALKSFVEDHGTVPLVGALPDMHADSNVYIQLQHIYRDQAAREVMDVRNRIRPILVPTISGVETTIPLSSKSSANSVHSVPESPKSDLITIINAIPNPRVDKHLASSGAHYSDVGFQPTYSTISVSQDSLHMETVYMACRNASYFTLVTTTSLGHEYTVPHEEWIRLLTSEQSTSELGIYILFRAVEIFHATHHYWPGTHLENYDNDVIQLRTTVREVLRIMLTGNGAKNDGSSLPTPTINLDDWVQEFVRAGPAELHTISAYMGGVAAQEAIKIITAQFLPIAGNYVYNGIASTSTLL